MKLFEVIFWGHLTPTGYDGNAEDTIYLVRASSDLEAAEDVQRNGLRSNHPHNPMMIADAIYELGTDSSLNGEAMILRGPYFNFAYNSGWPSWSRNIEENAQVEWIQDIS